MALLIKTDGTSEIIEPESADGKLTFRQIREAIGGGWIEHVVTDPKVAKGYTHIYLDEEGKIKKLLPNSVATSMSVYTMKDDILCGDVLFCTEHETI